MVKTRKKGLPKKLEAARQREDDERPEPTMEQVITELHGQMDNPQDALPSLEWLKSQYRTKSAIIRYLTSLGHSVGVIHKHTGIKYQMVRNVAVTPLKRGPNEDWRPKPQANNLKDRDVTKGDE